MKRVLLVDDEPELTDVVREYLQESYEVETAGSGTAALDSFRKRRPDVVFLDISMPGPSGLEVLKELRRADPTLPVVMVTVNTDVAVVQECLREGAFAYVPKPFDLKYVEHMAALATQSMSGGAAEPASTAP
jgi:CheY-like chemotaxis protein